ncbi:MAG: helix-turn-helix domain-containing protein [Acidobacteriota bacterium]|nr:helix-turn-helix domain-containing protein [Acidobacteriota bacterium]
MQKAEWILAAMDRLTTCLHSALDAANETAKELLTLWLDSLETDRTPHQQTTSNGFRSLVTIKELAELWDVSERGIRDWIAKESLPYRRVGADLRFDLIEVDEWTKRHRKNNRAMTAANGKVLPLQRRLQAKQGA